MAHSQEEFLHLCAFYFSQSDLWYTIGLKNEKYHASSLNHSFKGQLKSKNECLVLSLDDEFVKCDNCDSFDLMCRKKCFIVVTLTWNKIWNIAKKIFGWKLWNTLLVVKFEFTNWFFPNLENEFWKKRVEKIRDFGQCARFGWEVARNSNKVALKLKARRLRCVQIVTTTRFTRS